MKLELPGKAILATASAVFGWSMYRAYQTRAVHAEHFKESTTHPSTTGPVVTVPHTITRPIWTPILRPNETMKIDSKLTENTIVNPVDKMKHTFESIEATIDKGKAMVKEKVDSGKEEMENILPSSFSSTKPLGPSAVASIEREIPVQNTPIVIPEELLNDIHSIFQDSLRHKEFLERQLEHLAANSKTLSLNSLWQETENLLEDSRDHSVYVAEVVQHFLESVGHGKELDTSRIPEKSKGITGTITGYTTLPSNLPTTTNNRKGSSGNLQ